MVTVGLVDPRIFDARLDLTYRAYAVDLLPRGDDYRAPGILPGHDREDRIRPGTVP